MMAVIFPGAMRAGSATRPRHPQHARRTFMMKTFGKPAVIVAVALFGLLFLPFYVSAEPASPQASTVAKAEAGTGCDCCAGKCDCASCPKDCRCGHKKRMGVGPPMMEGMKKHMEEVRKRVAGLRDHEKKLEGVTDPVEFRKAAIEHLRMLDDLHESHVKHMESMAGGKGPGHPCKEPCKEPCPEHHHK